MNSVIGKKWNISTQFGIYRNFNFYISDQKKKQFNLFELVGYIYIYIYIYIYLFLEGKMSWVFIWLILEGFFFP